MAVFDYDVFTGSSGTALTSHTPNVGTSWTEHSSYSTGAPQLDGSGGVFASNANATEAYAAGTPASADYDVEADIVIKSDINAAVAGIVGRVATGADTEYLCYYQAHTGFILAKKVAGVFTQLGSTYTGLGTTLTSGTYTLKLMMRSSTIAATVNGNLIASVSDSAITAAGVAGLYVSTAATATTGPHVSNFRAYDPTVSANVADANLFFSPYNWYVNGSTYAQANACGAYVKAAFQSSSVLLCFDLTPNQGMGVADYPRIAYSIDNGPLQYKQLQAGEGSSSVLWVASGLSAGTHTIEMFFDAISTNTGWDRWTASANQVVRFTGLGFDAGGVTVAATGAVSIRPKRLVVFGDSIAEADNLTGIATGTANLTEQDATLSFVRFLAHALNAEYGNLSYAGQGMATNSGTAGSVPVFKTSYNNYDASHVRGALSPAPDYCLVQLGTNDGSGLLQADVATCITNVLSIVGSATKVFFAKPPGDTNGNFGGTAIANAVAASTDGRLSLIDLAASFSPAGSWQNGLTQNTGVANQKSLDGVHPLPATHGVLGAMHAEVIQKAVGGPGPLLTPIIWKQ